jgi:N-acetylglucosamine-6-phosphate deacetylase
MTKSSCQRIEGIHYRTGEVVAIDVCDGRICDIRPVGEPGRGTSYKAPGEIPSRGTGSPGTTGGDAILDTLYVAPGLVDLQVNGYGGYDFNTLPVTSHTVHEVTRRLWQEGVTSYLPTIVTNSDTAISEVLRVMDETLSNHPLLADCIPGIHLEGPFISPQDGPRGAHDIRYVRKPDFAQFERWQQAAGGRIRIVTLSPEWDGSDTFIERCVASGVHVSIGHTSATTEQIERAVAAGASLSTHLGNGAHPVLPRHPNYIWDQLAHDGLWACVIADGFHLPPSVLKVILRAKQGRVMVVSDSVYLAGQSPGFYETHIGGRVVLTPEGKLHLADHPELLAGSVLSLRHGVANLVRFGLCSLADAWDLASVHPARYLKLDVSGGLRIGAPADLVLFRHTGDGGIQIERTFKRGRLVYERGADGLEA